MQNDFILFDIILLYRFRNLYLKMFLNTQYDTLCNNMRQQNSLFSDLYGIVYFDDMIHSCKKFDRVNLVLDSKYHDWVLISPTYNIMLLESPKKYECLCVHLCNIISQKWMIHPKDVVLTFTSRDFKSRKTKGSIGFRALHQDIQTHLWHYCCFFILPEEIKTMGNTGWMT